ncbi:AbrB/MazE/SpoVT family DNA-binding domain-containing protein [Kitasatospora sp. NPDC058048]|uniref:AbrB/MazE/SpoVT family DNA-binding domain-containing protein n=1 Tax=Kitasatospora sp. NPDC058048 TaxID=3346313 RepID=UPI0036DECF2D
MTQHEPIVTTARIGQRGRLILPAQIQRAAHLTEGTTVAVRTAEDGTITIEPLWTVRARLRAAFVPLLDGHLPAGEARLHAGGLAPDEEPGPLPIPLQPLPDRSAAADGGRIAVRDDRRAVFTARAILAWFAAEPGSRVDAWLPYAVLPEPAVAELYTALARAGAHQRADTLLAELAVLGVRLPGPAKARATLAEDTAHAVQLTAEAARAGVEVPLSDALCAAAAHRLGVPLFAADLLPAEPGPLSAG